MKHMMIWISFVLLLFFVLTGHAIDGSHYDYSVSLECLTHPLEAQYGGGLLRNPAFENGLEGWNLHGNGKIGLRSSISGNKFIVAYNRSHPQDSFSQHLYLEKGAFYTVSAWVRINEGKETILAKTAHSNFSKVVGSVLAQSGCWSMLKGGFTVDSSLSAFLYFESNNTDVELWVDNMSLQSFTKSQWRHHHSSSIEKIRKRKLRLHVSDKRGEKIQGAQISIKQTKTNFPLGCSTADSILFNKTYQDWFTSRFAVTSFGNEMKWYFNERNQNHENYSIPDAMVNFFKGYNISVRGHAVFWDDVTKNLKWVQALSPKDLWTASMRRINSVMTKYSGQVISWDVMNENLHYHFFEDKLGPNASAHFYNIASKLDSKATLFMNEYGPIETPGTKSSSPLKFLQKLKEIRSFPGNEELVVGIGLQAHFSKPNIPYMRASLDAFAATNMPVWLTEMDVQRGPKQAEYLEEIMREAYSHPAVKGIIVWAGWRQHSCRKDVIARGYGRMCLMDENFNTLPAGYVVDKLIEEWKTNIKGETSDEGVYENEIFHGEYIVTVFNNHTGQNLTRYLEVSNEDSEALDVWISI